MVDNHLPEFMREIKEISYIMQAESDELGVADNAVKSSLDCSFAAFADDSKGGLERWERIFDIPKSGQTIEYRRQEILTRLLDKLPYTLNSLNSTLTTLYGVKIDGYLSPRHDLEVDYPGYTVNIFLNLELEGSLFAIEKLLRSRIPANMVLGIVLIFKKHRDLKIYTHNWLKTQTYLQIRRGGL